MTKSPTGRIKTDNPQMQNIPLRTHEATRLKKAFICTGTLDMQNEDVAWLKLEQADMAVQIKPNQK